MTLRNRACRVLLAAAIAAAPPAAAASGEPGGRRVEIVPMLGVRGGATMDAAVPGVPPAEADPAASFGLGVDWYVRPDGWLETFVDRQTLTFRADAAAFGTDAFDFTIDYLHFGGGYEPGSGRVRPFVTASVGLTRYAASTGSVDSSIALSGSLGGGFRVPISRTVGFRFEVRGYATAGTAAVSAASGPGLTFEYAANGWYQVALRAGFAIRL